MNSNPQAVYKETMRVNLQQVLEMTTSCLLGRYDHDDMFFDSKDVKCNVQLKTAKDTYNLDNIPEKDANRINRAFKLANSGFPFFPKYMTFEKPSVLKNS